VGLSEDDAITVATKAHEIAVRAEQKIDSHEVLCEMRYKNIEESNKDIKDALKTIRYVGITLILGVCAILFTNFVEMQKPENHHYGTHQQ
jgi:hypothetical protein